LFGGLSYYICFNIEELSRMLEIKGWMYFVLARTGDPGLFLSIKIITAQNTMISVNKVILSLECFEIIKLDFFSQKPPCSQTKEETRQKTIDT
jgi:hypothetical protein